MVLQIFIDPLRKVAGSCFVNDLLQHCTSSDQRRFFQALGMCLGYERWVEDWKEMVTEEKGAGQEEGVVRAESAPKAVAELSAAAEVSYPYNSVNMLYT